MPYFAEMYLRKQPTATMQQNPLGFNQLYHPGAQNAAMTSQSPNIPVSHSWVNPNPVLSMETVTINPSATVSSLPHPTISRQQQPKRGSESAYPHRIEHNFDSNILPQLSMRDLQCLDAASQGADMSQSQSQPLFQMQNHREVLSPETHTQTHPGNNNQGIQTVWPNFNPLNPVQNSFHGSVAERGGGSQGLGSLSLLEGIEEGDDFLKDLMETGSQTGFQLKQEPQMTVGQESHVSVMQSAMESQGNTYTNLLPRSMSNGSHADSRQEGSHPLKNVQNPYSNSSTATEAHFMTLADWIKATRHNN